MLSKEENITGASKCICLYQQIRQLETELQEHKGRNDSLVRMLDDESLKREIAEANLTHHKEALLEKAKELQERDQTIETQNTLLGFAWAEAQATLLAIRERDQRIELLNNQIEQIIPERSHNYSDINVNKKRKFSP